jgi:nicotinamidase-related amidase
MPPILLDPSQAMLLVIDMQERLMPAIADGERVLARAATMAQAARLLGLPVVLSEQYRKGLGPTVAPLVEALGAGIEPIEKITFGCMGSPELRQALAATGRRQMILCGVETHVCVLRTALEALAEGWQVFLAEDAVGSRRLADRQSALARLAQAGVVPASVEMLVMEALGRAGTEAFKAVQPLVRPL